MSDTSLTLSQLNALPNRTRVERAAKEQRIAEAYRTLAERINARRVEVTEGSWEIRATRGCKADLHRLMQIAALGMNLRALQVMSKEIPEVNKQFSKSTDEYRRVAEVATPGVKQGIELIDGGFSFHGEPYVLTGRPRAMLAALLKAPHQRATADNLRTCLKVNDERAEYPEQIIRDTAAMLRDALKKAWKVARRRCKNPLESTGKGSDLTYILAMP